MVRQDDSSLWHVAGTDSRGNVEWMHEITEEVMTGPPPPTRGALLADDVSLYIANSVVFFFFFSYPSPPIDGSW